MRNSLSHIIRHRLWWRDELVKDDVSRLEVDDRHTRQFLPIFRENLRSDRKRTQTHHLAVNRQHGIFSARGRALRSRRLDPSLVRSYVPTRPLPSLIHDHHLRVVRSHGQHARRRTLHAHLDVLARLGQDSGITRGQLSGDERTLARLNVRRELVTVIDELVGCEDVEKRGGVNALDETVWASAASWGDPTVELLDLLLALLLQSLGKGAH